ncbi:MAG: hypothetical protein PUE08_07695 [Eubacteriales bacterium]|nr:hypothetical protein [Eubacteriales bacterium]
MIMRTSKKLLSLFLAVVMVITTCSVGFTAFAKDSDNIWNDSAEASDAFKALNGLADTYLPSALMSVESISSGVYKKYASQMGKDVADLTDEEKADIANKATLTDILHVLQPMLIGMLAGVSQEDYALAVGSGKHSAAYYDYLLKDDGSIDFFTLYSLCRDYRQNENLSADTRATLQEWYETLGQIANLELNSAVLNKIEELKAAFVDPFGDEEKTWETSSLTALERFYTDDFMAANCDEETLAAMTIKYDELTTEYLSYGAPEDFVIDSFAKYLYYGDSTVGSNMRQIYAAYDAIQTAEKDMTYTGTYDILGLMGGEDFPEYTATGLTPENFTEKIFAAYFGTMGMEFSSYDELLLTVLMLVTGAEEPITPPGDDASEEEKEAFQFQLDYVDAMLSTSLIAFVTNDVLDFNYNAIVEGLTIKYSYGEIADAAEFEALVEAGLPEGKKLTEDEINMLASLDRSFTVSGSSVKTVPFATALSKGHLKTTDIFGGTIDFDLPDNFQDSYFSDMLAQILDKAANNGGSIIEKYAQNFRGALFDKFTTASYPTYYKLDGTPVTTQEVYDSMNTENVIEVQRDAATNLPVINYTSGAKYDEAVLEDIIADAERYAYGQIADEYLGGVSFTANAKTNLKSDVVFRSIFNANAVKPAEPTPELNDDQLAILYGDYDLTGAVGTDIINCLLNSTIGGILDPETFVGNLVSGVLDGLLITKVDLLSTLTDIWGRLCDDPMATVFELLPVLTVLVDELVVPLLLNGEGDQMNNFVDILISLGLGDILFPLSMDYGSYIGLKNITRDGNASVQLNFDLNQILPDLMTWLLADKADQKAGKVDLIGGYYYPNGDQTVQVCELVGDENGDNKVKTPVSYTGENIYSADFNNYTVKDASGNAVEKVSSEDEDGFPVYTYNYNGVSYSDDEFAANFADSTFYCYMTYKSNVPMITNIYLVDKLLAGACIGDLGKMLGNSLGDETLAAGLTEVITELATLFSESLDEFISSDAGQEARYKYNDAKGTYTRLSKGLNNITVALPRLFDIMENLAADKYGISRDAWVYCYGDGQETTAKIFKEEVNADGTMVESTSNARMTEFKNFAAEKNASVKILDCFVSIFVEDWLNAIISLFNNIIVTDNVITENLPIVASLLRAFDGFGENSVFTDVFNGIFQLQRSDDLSFNFEVQDNGLRGLSKENAMFLFNNVDTLINVIMSLVKSFSSGSGDTGSDVSAASLMQSFAAPVAAPAKSADLGISGYTADDIASVDKLIAKLDEMISSLLSKSSINDYAINTTGNIASGVVSLLSNYIGTDDAESLIGLIDEYLYYLDGAGTRTPDADGNMDAKKVYTNENLSDLVVRTFALIENIVSDLLANYDYVTGEGENAKTYNLLACAINGIISPDSIGVRLDDYADAQSEILDLKTWNSAVNEDGSIKASVKNIDWDVKDGDKDAFFSGLSASLRLLTSILGVLFVDAGIYENALQPILATVGKYVGFEVDSAEEYADAQNPYRDEALLGLLRPIVAFLDKFLAAPATTLIQTVEALAAILDDENTQAGTIASIVSNTLAPIANEIKGVSAILRADSDKLLPTSTTLAAVIDGWTDENLGALAEVNDKQELVNIVIKDYPLSGNNLVPIINTLLSGLGIELKAIDWKALSNAKSPADALIYVLEYLIDTVVDAENLETIIGLIMGDNASSDTAKDLIAAIQSGDITGKKLVAVVLKILDVTQNPTLFAWSFEKYLQEFVENFSYPLGLTKAQADEAATDIDKVINNIFPLLQSLGINLGGSNLTDILNNALFTNKLLTTLAVELYGALNSSEAVAMVLGALGIKSSTADVAALLTDTSYGATFSTAAQTIGSKASWSELKTVTKDSNGKDVTTYADINWGFTDGSANAQQGFVNALVAILRPVNDILAVFLNTGDLTIGSGLYDVICSLAIDETTSGDITFALKNGVFTLTLVDADNAASAPSVIKIDLTALEVLKDLVIKGTNGYNSAIIPLLEAFQCEGVVTEAQYKADIAAAKDSLLLDILNPILGASSTSLLNKIVASPLVAIATLVPTVSVYLEASGLTQMLVNLLAPVTDIIYAVNDAVDINKLAEALLGQSLGDYVAGVLGMAKGSLTIDFSNLATLNVEDMVIPLVNMLLKSTGIVFSNINWNAFAATADNGKGVYGDITTYTSAATDVNGNALTGKTIKNVDYGKVLITVLRYVFDNVINNIDAIKALVMGIVIDEKTGKKLSEDATLAPILNNVFNQIKTHTSDQLIVALYYFFVGSPANAYWDYTGYKYDKNVNFKFPEGVKEETVQALIAFLDGIIDEADLGGLLNQLVFTDSIINSLAKLIYTNIESVKISDGIMLGDILSIVGMTTDSATVATMLGDSKYGETKQFASAAAAIKAAGSWAKVDFSKLSWGVKDEETFLKALVAILRPFEGLLDVLLADGSLNILGGIDIPGSNDYVNSIVPLLEAFRCECIKSYDKYLASKNKAYDNLLLDILTPLFGFVDDVIAAPVETLASVLPNLALFIGNDGLVQFVVNLVTPITEIIKQINPIIDVDKLLQDLTKISNISITNLDKFLEPYIGGGNLIKLANKYLGTIGMNIPEIDWLWLAGLGTVKNENSAVECIGQRKVAYGDSDKVLIALLQYVLDVVLENKTAITGLLGKSYTGALKEILDMVFDMTSDELLALVFSLVEITQSPTEVFWSYEKYKSVNSKFKYPNGISAEDADNAVGQLDNMVSGVFALLQGMGVVGAADLKGLVGDMLFTNEILTQLAVELYGALGSEKVAPYLEMCGIAVSTKDVAKILTDKSYGKTYSSAAKTIKSKSSWDKLKKVKKDKNGKVVSTTYTKINWGFTNGAANAEQGFINGLVAIFRPFIDILGPFLNGTDLALGEILYGVITTLDITSGNKDKGENLTIFKDGKLTIQALKDGVYTTTFEMDFSNLETLKTLNLYGSNAYENSIIPLLDVLQVDNSEIKTFAQYEKDCKKAKDNVLLDVLNPLMAFVDDVLEAPFDTLTAVLPNLAYFIDNNGIGQLVDNLLSPLTQWIKEIKKDGFDLDKILKLAFGTDLGSVVGAYFKTDVKLNIKLTDLSSCNIQEVLLPLINSLLKSTGIKLPDFKWSTIASHGEVVTSKSQAENSKGKFTNKEVIADKGETLVAVLRYVADVLVVNAKTLKTLICSIDAVKKSDMLKSIIGSVFNTIGAADKDQIVLAVFYFLTGQPTNAFWDYTAYQTGEFDFAYPENMDVDFLKNLGPMLDGLIGGLADLNGLIGDALYTDKLVSQMAVGLYGAIEKVNISGDTNLTDLLAMTDIDFSAAHVAKLLVNDKYGQSYPSASSVIANAGSWANVSADSLKWGVTDRDSFFHALVAVLRPIYGVLDVLLNDAYLGLFDIVRLPGSNGYTSSIVPLLEAFSCYNVKTQYQYREDINEEYDNILLDIINPIWDKIEDLLYAPIEVLAEMIPNLALFIGNDGLCQILDNLLTPISALVDAIKPVVNLNDLVDALLSSMNVDLGALLGKIGITNFSLDLYDLNATLKPILGGDAIIPLINSVLGLIKIGGQPLGLKLNDVEWLRLASHGEIKVGASQAATYGSRIYVEGDSAETLIAVLRYLIDTVNAGDNFDKISSLISGLLGDSVDESISGVISQVLGVLQGDTDEVIASLVELLEMLG